MTPHRRFQNEDSQVCDAWDVVPSWGERRVHQRRTQDLGPPAFTGERRKSERRQRRGIRIALTAGLAGGWLAFESETERRRLAPIPDGWHELSEEALQRLWRGAEVLPHRKRRLIE